MTRLLVAMQTFTKTQEDRFPLFEKPVTVNRRETISCKQPSSEKVTAYRPPGKNILNVLYCPFSDGTPRTFS